MDKISFYTLLSLSIISFSFIIEKQKIKAIPGVGIVIKNDTIFIKKTSPAQLASLLNLNDTFFVGSRISDGVEIQTGKSTYNVDWVKHVTYKEMEFEFSGKSKDSLKLQRIRIKYDPVLSVAVNDFIKLGQLNPKINKYFKKLNKYDYISEDKLSYSFYSQGISFHFEKKLFSRKLVELCIHSKIEERKK